VNVINKKFERNDPTLTLRYIQNYLLDFVNYENMLVKRISKAFSMNKFLYQYTTQDDVKQDVYVKLFHPKCMEKFLWMGGKERLKYFNTIVSNVLFDTYRQSNLMNLPLNIDLDNYMGLTLAMEESDSKNKMLQELWELFISEHLERQVIELYYLGHNDSEIKDILNISQYTFEKIRENIRDTLIKKGYKYLNKEENKI
jgi:DNA-directed RNA polymerase specialized sigma24 family protein